MQLAAFTGNTALVIGHPGHELRLFHWLEVARPEVFVLTDGSGGAGNARIKSTSRIVEQTGCRQGSIFGAHSDRRIYDLIINQRFDPLIRFVDELVVRLEEHDIDCVVGDACEGYSPTHDLCRMLIDTAVEIVSHRRGAKVDNFDFFLSGRPDNCAAPLVRLHLTDEQFARKMKSAYAYTELAAEVARATEEVGTDAFRVECLRPVSTSVGASEPPSIPPYYETYGQEQVSKGRYQSVLRFRQHMAPLAKVLCDYATQQVVVSG